VVEQELIIGLMNNEALPKRDAVSNLFVGAFLGALAATIATTIVVFIFLVWNGSDRLDYDIAIAIIAGLFAGVIGLPFGLLIALVDNLAHGRLRNASMSFWKWIVMWIVIGVGLGMVGANMLGFAMDGFSYNGLGIFQFVAGALCGLIAGPIFGLLYRERA
jgi:uncharacterized protein YacL